MIKGFIINIGNFLATTGLGAVRLNSSSDSHTNTHEIFHSIVHFSKNLAGQYMEKQFEMVNSRLPKSIDDETIGEKVIELGVDLGLDKLKDTLTEE